MLQQSCNSCKRAATELQLLLRCRLLSECTNCRCADAAISSRNPNYALPHKLMHCRLPPYCRGLLYMGVDGVARHLSACLAVGRLLSRSIPFSAALLSRQHCNDGTTVAGRRYHSSCRASSFACFTTIATTITSSLRPHTLVA